MNTDPLPSPPRRTGRVAAVARPARWAAIFLALILVGLLGRVLVRGGALRTIEPRPLAGCERIEGVVGAEDVTVNRDRGWAYVSSFDRRAAMREEKPRGRIYRLSIATSSVTEMKDDLPGGFSPHGLSLFVDPRGAETLMVVDHEGGHAIRIFDVVGERLVLRRTVQGELLVSPNDVHAVDADRFYATNDHGFGLGPMRLAEDLLPLSRGTVVAFDGDGLEVAFAGTNYANGVQSSADGRRLFVSESVGQRLLVLSRQGMALRLERALDLGTGLDNIERDEQGRLWIGAHPKLLAFMGHAEDPASSSPSQVLRVTLVDGAPTIEEVYLDDGAQLSGGAVAAVSEDRMLLGPVFAPYMLSCPRPP